MGEPYHCGQDRYCTSNDVHQLVHLPNCLLVSNVPLQSSEISGGHPIGLLRFRHNLQVRRGACHLPNFLCQVSEEVSVTHVLVLQSFICPRVSLLWTHPAKFGTVFWFWTLFKCGRFASIG